MALVHLWSCYQSWSWFPDMRWEWGAQGFEQNWGFGKWRLETPDIKNGFGRIQIQEQAKGSVEAEGESVVA